MVKNKYLQDIGIQADQMTTNYNGDNDPREQQWKIERDTYGFDERETWCMERSFAEWMYSHLMMYKESCCINLKFYKFEYDQKIYTQEEAIDFILSCCKEYLLCDSYIQQEQEVLVNMQKAIVLFSIIFPAMWW